MARATWRWRMTLWTTCSTLSKDLPTAIRAKTISLTLFSRYIAPRRRRSLRRSPIGTLLPRSQHGSRVPMTSLPRLPRRST
ncbi:hypothetical protein PF001_g30022 [Phytophthora fragariae]|uniref:Uncharacterized protein n=1 Tax=Phytophthora fragariae TaxID=53985 RepID=A0A6A4B1Q8_9STRA|nr:hypothetical protein PF001_g30022 [Phytophthora fragariae]